MFPMGIAITPDGSRAYIANFAASTVSVIDTTTNQVVGAPIAVGMTPMGIAITPNGSRAYVANFGSSNLSVIATQTNTVAGAPIVVGTQPRSVAITPDQPPKASLKTLPSGLRATLKGDGSSDPDGQVATYSWDFGDGKSATTTTLAVKHTYKKVGEFTARLTLTDNEGCSTAFVFTGQTASCNGSSVASVTRRVATMKLGRLKRNTEDGTAILAVKVPGKGKLKLSGKGVAKQRTAARASSLAKAVKHRGTVKLRIKAKGKAKRKLDRTGRVKVKVKVTFKPKGGDPNTQSKRIKLIERP
jgi:YVTN family beta-propeller protein